MTSHIGRIRCNLAICTCRKQIGRFQSEYELQILEGKQPIDVLNELGFIMMCCRLNMMYPPTHPVVDANAGRIINEGGIFEQLEDSEIYRSGPEIYLDDVPDFPQFK
jgi:DNA-directed RNA polymerase subunit N (RpoN/RPB10)